MRSERAIVLATRGSALALAQARLIFDECRRNFPKLEFKIKTIRTTGDRLQRASLRAAGTGTSLPKGLFTKELEVALVQRRADLAVHSLKDLPTTLPAGLGLGAVSRREDVRDVLVYRVSEPPDSRGAVGLGRARRALPPGVSVDTLPRGAVVGTGSPRRRLQLLERRADLQVVEIRGNVVTRLNRLADRDDLDAVILAAAGLARLDFLIGTEGGLTGDAVPEGLGAARLEPEIMLPCVGQAALGIEIRRDDERIAALCRSLNHYDTYQCVTAERAFLSGMGGGCQSPVAAYATVEAERLRLQAVSFRDGSPRRGELTGDVREAEALGRELALRLGGSGR